jgi:hypothetical protein
VVESDGASREKSRSVGKTIAQRETASKPLLRRVHHLLANRLGNATGQYETGTQTGR